MKKEKNVLIEFWRVLFCITVLGVHFSTAIGRDWFHSAYMGVEYFFLVSGFFLGSYYMKHMEGKPLKERLSAVWKYFVSRVKRLFPLYWGSMILMLIVRLMIGEYTLGMVPGVLKRCFTEFFMLQWVPIGDWLGFETEVLVSSNWFMPAIFFGSLITVFLLALFQKWEAFFIGPVITFSVYGYFCYKLQKFDIIISHYSIIRGVAAVSIGVFVYFLVAALKLENIKEKTAYIYFATIVSTILFTVVFVYTMVGHHGKMDFFMLFVLAVALFILTSARPMKLPEWFHKVFGFLGGQTFAIYCAHFPLIQLIVALFFR